MPVAWVWVPATAGPVRGDRVSFERAAPVRGMAETAASTDMGVGLTVLFSLLTLGGAVGMYVLAPERAAAWAFGAAVVFGALAVVAAQAYGAETGNG